MFSGWGNVPAGTFISACKFLPHRFDFVTCSISILVSMATSFCSRDRVLHNLLIGRLFALSALFKVYDPLELDVPSEQKFA